MSTVTTQDAIKAATSVARDIADGGLDPASLEAQAVAECRELFGTVAGPDDPLWELHRDVARQVLGLDGVPADELAEWLAIARQRVGEPVGAPDPADAPPEPETPTSGEHSAEPDPLQDDDQPPRPPWAHGVDVPPPPPPRRGEYDPLRGWSPGDTLPQ